MTTTLPSNHAERQLPLRQLALSTTCPLTRALATQELHRLTDIENRERVQISLALEAQSRASQTTHRPPIKCGLRNAKDHAVGFKMEGHWFFDKLHEKDAKKLQKLIDEWVSAFGQELSRALAFKLAGAGKNLKQALKFFKCEVFLDLPQEVRLASGDKITKAVEAQIEKGV